MDFTLHQLQVFLRVTQTESITKAADDLYLTQPAVSIQLKNFQRQFDIPLTEIVGRKLHVTEFGREIAAAAEKILNEVHDINHRTLAFKGLLSGRLRISVVSTGKYVMPYFLSDFMRRYPAIELIMDVTNKTKVIENLENNEVDFSLVSVMPDKLALRSEPLMRNSLYLVTNTETRYKSRPYDLSILQEMPLIYREAGSGTRYVMEKFVAEKNLQLRKMMELTSNEAVKQAVLAGLGASIMPLIGIRNEIKQEQLQIVPVKGLPIESTWQVVWLENKQHSPQADAFLNYLRENKARIIREKFSWLEAMR